MLLLSPIPSHSITFARSDSLCITNVACTFTHTVTLQQILTNNINWFLLLTKFSLPVNLLTYIISSLFKLTIILVPLMLSHLLVHLPHLPWRSQIALFSMPRLISGTNFLFHFVNQFQLFTLISTHHSLLHFLHPSLLHSFTLNSELTLLVNPFRHRSLTIDIPDWLLRLMGTFSVSLYLSGLVHGFSCGSETEFLAHAKIGNFIIIDSGYNWIST